MHSIVSPTLQIGGAVTPHDGQCHLRNVTQGVETYYEYEEALRLVRTLARPVQYVMFMALPVVFVCLHVYT